MSVSHQIKAADISSPCQTGLILDLHSNTEAPQLRDAVFSIGAYQLPRLFSKVPPTLSHLTCKLQRIRGLRYSGRSIHCPWALLHMADPSAQWWEQFKAEQGRTHLSSSHKYNPLMCNRSQSKKQKSRPEPHRQLWRCLGRIITQIINGGDSFSQTLSLCWYSLMMIYDHRPLMRMQWFITALKAARLTNSDY